MGALITAGVNMASGSGDETEPRQDTAAVESQLVDPDRLRSVLLPLEEYPPGTVMTQYNIREALSENRLQPPAGIEISPVSCTNPLDMRGLDGWTQLGTTPENHKPVEVAAVSEREVDVDAILRKALECRSGTVRLPEYGLSGRIQVTAFEATGLDGARAIGIQQTVTFPDDDSELAKQMADAGTSAQVYVSTGQQLLLVACSKHPRDAVAAAVLMQERLKGVGAS